MQLLRSLLRRLLSTEARQRLVRTWCRAWMCLAGSGLLPGWSTWMAERAVPPYYGRHQLSRFHPRGYTAPSAALAHPRFTRGAHTSLADRVIVYQDRHGGPVSIGDRTVLNYDVCVQTGSGGSVTIGADTHIQPRCQFSAYVGAIRVGNDVQIAPSCFFYPYDHAIEPGRPISRQGFVSAGDIVIEDGAWLGANTVVLAGTTIGRGAVIGAGAVVKGNVPPGAIAAGVPAKVLGTRAGRGTKKR